MTGFFRGAFGGHNPGYHPPGFHKSTSLRIPALRRVAAARSSHARAAPALQGTPPHWGLALLPAAFLFLPLFRIRKQKRLKENERSGFPSPRLGRKQPNLSDAETSA